VDSGSGTSASWRSVLGSNRALLPATEPLGVSNDLMASVAGHSMVGAAIAALPSHALPVVSWLYLEYIRVLATTGPLFVSEQLLAHRLASLIGGFCSHGTIGSTPPRILGKSEYAGSWPERSLVRHIHGSSWHDGGGSLIWQSWRHLKKTGIP